MNRLFLAFALLVLHIGVTPAQATTAAELEARIRVTTLSNGARVIAAPYSEGEDITVWCYFAAGTDLETEATAGATSVLLELWNNTTGDELTAKRARAWRYYSNPDFVVARATWPKTQLREALQFAAENWMKPRLSGFSTARAAALRARDAAKQAPQRLFTLLVHNAYRNHPYGVSAHGTPGGLDRLTDDDFSAHLGQLLSTGNLVVCVAGACSADDVQAAATDTIGRIAVGPAAPRKDWGPTQRAGYGRYSQKGVSSWSGVIVGYRKSPGADPSIAAWDVLLALAKDRISHAIAPERGNVRYFDAGQGPAMRLENLAYFAVLASPSADMGLIEEAIVNECDLLGKQKPSAAAFEQVKKTLIAEHKPAPSNQIGQHLADWLVMAGDWKNHFRYADWLQRVTPDEVHALARESFQREFRISVVSEGKPAETPAPSGTSVR